ncbi:expressed unknown protein [Seminavis robusta]|uniref:Uncharacterized protein n=1 Tax=Seminavis robusta TaxID=568900 RepID=A0A9N8DJV0_9STRA|nr:expressed unknown protein [Seminavis robusta]|eukprot:Sro161_g072600.1 n/a (73) ;mRNA; f:76523-76957
MGGSSGRMFVTIGTEGDGKKASVGSVIWMESEDGGKKAAPPSRVGDLDSADPKDVEEQHESATAEGIDDEED